MTNKPKVSIVCITYNHEKYIKQALQSFVTQKTNFDFEVIIGEDHSSDNTKNIINEFKKKYPNIIKPKYNKKNLGVMKNLVYSLKRARGKYISLCEGDDFFTNINKLQLQVNFLDKNPSYSICFHPVNVFFEEGSDKNFIYPYPDQDFKFTTQELLKFNFISTNSVVYRNQNNYQNIPINIIPGDWFLHLYHAKVGKIGFMNKIMSSYRKHSNGLWWNYEKDIDRTLMKFGYNQLSMYFKIISLFKNKKQYKKIVFNNIDYIFNRLLQIDKNQNTKFIEKILINFPKEISDYLINSNKYRSVNVEKKLEKLKEITDSKLYKIWPVYTKIKKNLLKVVHKFYGRH